MINRLRSPIGLSVFVLVAFTGSIVSSFAADRPPNIVHIVADDVGYDDIGCFGAKDIKTPNLDRLAARGMKLTSFYSPAPYCTASRAAMMTGCYADRIGIPPVLFPYSKIGINANEVTIGELLKGRGYRTAVIGKWHLGHHPEFLPVRHGFDFYFGIPYPNDHEPDRRGWSKQAGREHYIPPPMPLFRNEKIIEEPAELERLPQRFTVEAVRFIRENKARPFFLHFSNIETHTPWFTPSRFAGTSQAGSYGDAVQCLDWSVGQIVATLDDLNLLDNTLIVFHSDNGYLPPGSNNSDLPSVYGKYATVDASRQHIVRGGKGTLFEGGVRVSCIASWLGKIPEASSNGEITASFDWFATFAKLAGADVPADRVIDGKDISPLIFNQPGAKSPHEAFYYYHGGNLGGVRQGKWKLSFPGVGRGGGGGAKKAEQLPELYDLEADLGEKTNVADAHSDIVRQLLALAEKSRDDIGDARLGRKGRNVREVGRIEPK
jgi:arylsulfatase A-like enzyme